MTPVPVGVPVAWTCGDVNDLQGAGSLVEIGSDYLRHWRSIR
jgi:hypothetical protein